MAGAIFLSVPTINEEKMHLNFKCDHKVVPQYAATVPLASYYVEERL